jgi:hypothetical protein
MQLIHQLLSLKEYSIANTNTGDHTRPLCVICPWQQVLQLAHGRVGCSDPTPRGCARSRWTPVATMQRAARCSERAPK